MPIRLPSSNDTESTTFYCFLSILKHFQQVRIREIEYITILPVCKHSAILSSIAILLLLQVHHHHSAILRHRAALVGVFYNERRTTTAVWLVTVMSANVEMSDCSVRATGFGCALLLIAWAVYYHCIIAQYKTRVCCNLCCLESTESDYEICIEAIR